MHTLFDRDAFLQRLEVVTEGKPYAWAARHKLPKHVVASIREGVFMPQKKTRQLIEEKTGLNTRWLIYGEEPRWLPGRAPGEQLAGAAQSSQSAVSGAEQAETNREPLQEKGGRVEGKDMLLMALAGAAIDMAFTDLDLAGDMSVEERGKLAGALHDTFFERREGVTARMMADFLVAAWRNSRKASA